MKWNDIIYDYLQHANNSDLNRGKMIERRGGLSTKSLSDTHLLVSVPSQNSNEKYQVQAVIKNNQLELQCSCPAYNRNDECKHGVAAALHLLHRNADMHFEEEVEKELSDERELTFKTDHLNFHQLCQLGGNPKDSDINKLLRKTQMVDHELNLAVFHVHLSANSIYNITIRYDGKETYDTSCNCGKNEPQLCVHVLACFKQILIQWGDRFFKKIKDFTEEKNRILSAYGLTLNDPEAELFKWSENYYGQLLLQSKPDFIIPAGDTKFLHELKSKITGKSLLHHDQIRMVLPENALIDYEVGILFNFSIHRPFSFELDALIVQEKKGVQKIKKININNPANHGMMQPLPDELFNAVIELSEQRLLQWLSAQTGNYHISSYALQDPNMSQAWLEKIKNHFFSKLQTAWPHLCNHSFTYILTEGNFSQANCKPVKLSKDPLVIGFEAIRSEKFITVQLAIKINGERHRGIFYFFSKLLFFINDTLYLPSSEQDILILDKFKHGKLQFPVSEIKNVLLHLLLPLKEKYEVEMNEEQFGHRIKEATPQPRVLLSEVNEQSLLLRPQFMYEDMLVDYNTETEFVKEQDDLLVITKRNKAEEKKLYDYLRTLHPRFASQNNNQHFYLPFTEVLKNNWFFNALKQIEDAGFPVYGLKELKKFRYNTGTPKINIEAGSGVDWFDLNISAQWGDQQVALKELRKAIINKQEAILLDDGTLGLIPQQWISQYRTLLKIGSEQNGSLKLSKLHFGLLDQLDSNVNTEDVQQEIAAKKKRLQEFNGMKSGKLPKGINATLRPYQQSGFHWMKTLDELGWGGCLADDMGLGKTLQAITFLQYIKEKNKGSTSLVICPTSLLFNWESELQKFCPTLKFHVYYGLQREFSEEHFEQYDVVITSYGIARNDLESLIKFQWHYLILDESQAIKNPDAQVTRAVAHLKAKNKLILTGTPVQNNTYDLYAQFNFINPGLLGSRDFFREEFASAIDKNEDKTKAEELRRLVYPFMLRRTKEQVATDLPDKTETVLWCNMGKAQRKVYDDYKNYYRNLLLKKIDEEGMGKSGIYVLEGLLRLRQICDHPALLKDAEIEVTDSVKTEELLREIQENTGDHKLLVFSQFTEMLAIIKQELQNKKIHCCYLDGSTPAEKRKEQVQKFQSDESIKVFLISLKAGGVGLNLTAADYVYLVDPWWNPAAEQQAIDRTHRIGQTRKIFAYKMICKDTVEEKILQLQQKKKALANELVSEEAGFVKKLTRDDIAFLFS